MTKSIYLVLDPQMKEQSFNILEQIIDKGISYIQIWDHFSKKQDIAQFIQRVYAISNPYQVPLLINNRWEWLLEQPLDGVHFDNLPTDLQKIKNAINRDVIIGITCGNDIRTIQRAAKQKINYISFCSVFPSPSVETCEIINHENIKEARKLFKNKIFLSGGIVPANISELHGLDYNGIAVISGLMNAKDPVSILKEYKKQLNQ